jgi:hypothetical protein
VSAGRFSRKVGLLGVAGVAIVGGATGAALVGTNHPRHQAAPVVRLKTSDDTVTPTTVPVTPTTAPVVPVQPTPAPAPVVKPTPAPVHTTVTPTTATVTPVTVPPVVTPTTTPTTAPVVSYCTGTLAADEAATVAPDGQSGAGKGIMQWCHDSVGYFGLAWEGEYPGGWYTVDPSWNPGDPWETTCASDCAS